MFEIIFNNVLTKILEENRKSITGLIWLSTYYHTVRFL